MGFLSLILHSRIFLFGFSLLVLAFSMSAVSVFYSHPVSYASSGVLGGGEYVLGNQTFEEYIVTNRTLSLISKNASIAVSWGTNYTSYNLTGGVILHPTGRPTLNVFKGKVNYTYNVKAVRYPYTNLAIPAFVFAITGTIFAWVGLERALRG